MAHEKSYRHQVNATENRHQFAQAGAITKIFCHMSACKITIIEWMLRVFQSDLQVAQITFDATFRRQVFARKAFHDLQR